MSPYDTSQDEMLIDLVSKRPILYSSSHPQYRNCIERYRAWEEISTILNTPIPGLKLRWKHIRDHYYKKIKQTSKKTEWKHKRLLGFLSQHPKKDALSENATEKKEMKQKLSTVTHNESSDFSNVSEFENEGSESASSIGSFSYKQVELLQPEFASSANHLDLSYKETKNQTNHKHAQIIKEKQEIQSNRQIFEGTMMGNILNYYSLPGALTPSSSNHKSSESQTGEMSIDTSLEINTNSNNHEIHESTTMEQTSVPGVIGANSETIRWSKFYERIRAEEEKEEERIYTLRMSPTQSVYRFYEAVAEIVSMFPPHLISESKLMIHKYIYRFEKERLAVMYGDDDNGL